LSCSASVRRAACPLPASRLLVGQSGFEVDGARLELTSAPLATSDPRVASAFGELLDATPTCADCGERMTFYGQLDSIGDDVVLADVGLVYVFVCFNDFEARAIVQSG
jgi:hypothetical protein